MSDFFNNYFNVIDEKSKSIDYKELISASELANNANKDGGKIIIVGNGGSAAIASHVSVDFTKAAGMRATCFNESSLITCFANDYGYENWMEKAVEIYGDTKDMVILVSSSGSSENVIKAAGVAKRMDMKIVTFSGFMADNPLKQCGDINLWVDSKAYNIIENMHMIWLTAVCDAIIGKAEYSVS